MLEDIPKVSRENFHIHSNLLQKIIVIQKGRNRNYVLKQIELSFDQFFFVFWPKVFSCPIFSPSVGRRRPDSEQRPEAHKMNEIVTSLTLVGNLSQLPPTIQVNENLSAPGFCQQAFILSISLMISSNFRHGYQINRGDFLSKGS